MSRWHTLALLLSVVVFLAACQGGEQGQEPPAPPRPTPLAPQASPQGTPERAAEPTTPASPTPAGQPIVATALPEQPATQEASPMSGPAPQTIPIPVNEPLAKGTQAGPFYVEQTQMERSAGRVLLQVQGNRPRPCDGVAARVQVQPDAQQVAVEVFSVQNPRMLCVEMLAPTVGIVDLTPWLQDLPPGTYTVTLNGQEVGSVTRP